MGTCRNSYWTRRNQIPGRAGPAVAVNCLEAMSVLPFLLVGAVFYKVAAKPELVSAEPRLLGEIQSEDPGST